MDLFRILYPRCRALYRYWMQPVSIKPLLVAAIGLCLWAGIFFAFYRVLAYFQGIESLGDFLAAKLLSMILVVFLSILLFSNIIAALSTFFLSRELQLVLSLPVSLSSVYGAKLIETTFSSSWMVFLFGFPVFLAYGMVYHASWVFYAMCLVLFIPFLLIAAVVSTIVVMGLVVLFPARRTKDVLLVLSILFVIVLYLLIRFLKPELLVDPEHFANMIDYLTGLRTFSSPFLPTYWTTEALLPLMQPHYHGSPLFYGTLLWSTGLALVVIGEQVFLRIFFQGWSKSQESKRVRLSRGGVFNAILTLLTARARPATQAIIAKDVKIFFRDTTQWSQLLLLMSLIIVYLYNFKVLPLDTSPIPSFYLQNLFSFLNLGLAGFVLAAVAVRFVYPSVSLEGHAFWIIKTAPVSLKRFLLSKYGLNLVPLLVLALVLIVCSNYLLKVSGFMTAVSIGTIVLLAVGITSLGIGIGAMHPRFGHTNTAEIPSGYGGLLFMIISLFLVGITVVLEAGPVYLYFASSLHHVPVSFWTWTKVGLAFFLILVLNMSAVYFPLRYGLRNLSNQERLE